MSDTDKTSVPTPPATPPASPNGVTRKPAAKVQARVFYRDPVSGAQTDVPPARKKN
jgi:hypothetical protein